MDRDSGYQTPHRAYRRSSVSTPVNSQATHAQSTPPPSTEDWESLYDHYYHHPSDQPTAAATLNHNNNTKNQPEHRPVFSEQAGKTCGYADLIGNRPEFKKPECGSLRRHSSENDTHDQYPITDQTRETQVQTDRDIDWWYMQKYHTSPVSQEGINEVGQRPSYSSTSSRNSGASDNRHLDTSNESWLANDQYTLPTPAQQSRILRRIRRRQRARVNESPETDNQTTDVPREINPNTESSGFQLNLRYPPPEHEINTRIAEITQQIDNLKRELSRLKALLPRRRKRHGYYYSQFYPSEW